jgi:hypothetical protein
LGIAFRRGQQPRSGAPLLDPFGDVGDPLDGGGIVSPAGLALLQLLADRTGLTARRSEALATPGLLVHDRGRVVPDLACADADGAE